MNGTFRPVDKSLEGGRILYRQHLATQTVEGWVREFDPAGIYVRISKTNRPSDAGTWLRSADLRCEAVLEPAKAPAATKSSDGLEADLGHLHELPDESGDLPLGN